MKLMRCLSKQCRSRSDEQGDGGTLRDQGVEGLSISAT